MVEFNKYLNLSNSPDFNSKLLEPKVNTLFNPNLSEYIAKDLDRVKANISRWIKMRNGKYTLTSPN